MVSPLKFRLTPRKRRIDTASTLTILDPYYEELSRVPLMTRDEEIAAGTLAQAGDQAGVDQLVQRNLRLVASVARQYIGTNWPIEDLVQEGNIGLIRAAQRYDPTRGIRFSTYAVWWIRQAIQRGLADYAALIRLPVHQHATVSKVIRTRQRLVRQLERKVTPDEIAAELKVPRTKIEEALALARDTLSLDRLVQQNNDSETTWLGYLPDHAATAPDSESDRRATNDAVAQYLDRLPPKVQTVLRHRFGIGGIPAMTLVEIAQVMGHCKEWVRQIEIKGIQRLRELIPRDLA